MMHDPLSTPDGPEPSRRSARWLWLLLIPLALIVLLVPFSLYVHKRLVVLPGLESRGWGFGGSYSGPDFLRPFLTAENRYLVVDVEEASYHDDEPIIESDLEHILSHLNLKSFNSSSDSFQGRWLEHFAGLKNLTDIDIDEAKITDIDLRHLSPLTGLAGLSLTNMPITDAGLEHLAPLINLEVLYLDGTQVTGSGFHHFAGYRSLRVLSLSGTPLTDKGIEHLARLSITKLDLNATPVTDAQFRLLAPIRQLESLHLEDVPITDASADTLAGFTHLTFLHLPGTDITDATIERLDSPDLLELSLVDTAVTSACLRHLARFRKLETLYFPQEVQLVDKDVPVLKTLPATMAIYIDTFNLSDRAKAELRSHFPNLREYR